MTTACYKEPGETLGHKRRVSNVALRKCSVVLLSDMNVNGLWLEVDVTDRPLYKIITG